MTFIVIRKGVAQLLPTVLMAAITMPAFAENSEYPLNRDNAYSLSPFVGGHTFDDAQALEESPVFGLRAGYNFTPHWGMELAFGYTLAESEIANYPESDVYQYMLDGLYHFKPEGKLVPFVALGIGGERINQPAPGFADSNDELLNFGFGIKYFISKSVALRGDLRQVMAHQSGDENLVYTIGVTFLKGGKKRAVANAGCTPCAAAAATTGMDTTPPYVTLTAPFHAATSIASHRMVRVAFSEPLDTATINDKTFTVWQGETRINGTVLAPTSTTASFSHEAEFLPDTTYTGRVSAGVKDAAGNPMTADYVWSFATAKTSAAGNTVVIDKLVTLEDTHFKFDSAALTPEGETALQKNIQNMRENPGMKARIAGYSSASGTREYNQALSERRANTVMAFIVDKGGIAPERLDSIGYGETRPAVYEELPEELRSKAAKANMRVLFEVIVK